MSEYGREWERARNAGPEASKDFELRTLRESYEQHRAALNWIRLNVADGSEIVRKALWVAGYDERGAPPR